MGKSTLVLILVALLAGIGIGFVLANSLGDQAEESTPPSAEPGRTPSGARKPTVDLPPPPKGGYRDLTEALASIPIPDVKEGTGVITGRITRQDGSPVEGAVVVASRMLGPTELPHGVFPGGDEDLTTLVVNTVQRAAHARNSRRQARTGPDGAYRIEGLAEGRHHLQASKSGYNIHSRSGGWVSPGGKCDFQAQARVGLEITVLLPDGTEAETATVVFKAQSSTNNHAWSPKRRLIQLNPGRWEVQALAGRSELASGKQWVTIAIEEPAPAITLQLETRPGIRGKVIFSEQQGNEYVQVACMSVSPDREADPGLLRRSGRKAHVDRQNDNTFAFPDLAPGTYLIGLLVGEEVEESATVTVKDRMVEQNLTVGPPDPGETFILVATGPDGEPVEGLKIQTGYTSNRGNSSGSARYVGLGQGRFRVWHHKPREERVAEGGTNYVKVTSKEFGTRSEAYAADATADITLRFEEPATLKVTLSGLAESGYADMITLTLAGRVDRDTDASIGVDSSGSVADAEGNRVFGPIAPGRYTLQVHFRYEEYMSFQIASEPITVGPGDNAKVIVLPTLYTVTVNVGDLSGRGSLSLRRISPSNPEVQIWSMDPRDGKLIIRGIPAGTYSLRASGGPGMGHMNIVVPGASVVDFEPKEANALQVTGIKAGGLLEKSGFREGDMIIGIEGETFKGELEMQSKFMAAMSKGVVKVTVLRGTQTLELGLDLSSAFKGRGDIGGRMEPMCR